MELTRNPRKKKIFFPRIQRSINEANPPPPIVSKRINSVSKLDSSFLSSGENLGKKKKRILIIKSSITYGLNNKKELFCKIILVFFSSIFGYIFPIKIYQLLFLHPHSKTKNKFVLLINKFPPFYSYLC